MGRPLIGTRPLTNAEHQARYRAKHGRKLRPGNAARQARWRARRADELTVEVKVAQVAREAAPLDPLYVQAVAALQEQGKPELVEQLRSAWPYMAVPVRQEMAAGRGFRFWLGD
jgi:hypothetical protein